MAAFLQRKLAAIKLTSVGKRFTWTDERKPFSSKCRCPEQDNLAFSDYAYGRRCARSSFAYKIQLLGWGRSPPWPSSARRGRARCCFHLAIMKSSYLVPSSAFSAGGFDQQNDAIWGFVPFALKQACEEAGRGAPKACEDPTNRTSQSPPK